MGEEAPLYGVDSTMVLTNPGVQECNLSHKPANDYSRQEVGLFKRNTADLEE
jgi:hypothetical protein